MNKLNLRNLRLADFGYNFNKMRQRFSDMILQEGRRPYRYSDASQKITSELAEVRIIVPGDAPLAMERTATGQVSCIIKSEDGLWETRFLAAHSDPDFVKKDEVLPQQAPQQAPQQV